MKFYYEHAPEVMHEVLGEPTPVSISELYLEAPSFPVWTPAAAEELWHMYRANGREPSFPLKGIASVKTARQMLECAGGESREYVVGPYLSSGLFMASALMIYVAT